MDLHSGWHIVSVLCDWGCCYFDSTKTKVKGLDFGAVEEVKRRVRGKREDRANEKTKRGNNVAYVVSNRE